MRSAFLFDGEAIPRGYRIWDPTLPPGTRGFKLCPKERLFILYGTQKGEPSGLQETYKEICGVETHLIVVDYPIKVIQINEASQGYCTKCDCNLRGGVKIRKDDPRYGEVIKILMSYIINENDIDFYR